MENKYYGDQNPTLNLFVQPKAEVSDLHCALIESQAEGPDMIDLEAGLCFLREDARKRNQRFEGEVAAVSWATFFLHGLMV